MNNEYRLLFYTRVCIWIIIVGLFLSGLTAFPIETELKWLLNHTTGSPDATRDWLKTIYHAVKSTNQKYPYLGYGTDWLAFAHLALAMLFIGPLKDPVKNIWVIEFGILACLMIIPVAFIAGNILHIPVFWRLIDCSFGVIGLIPLLIAYRNIIRLSLYRNHPFYV